MGLAWSLLLVLSALSLSGCAAGHRITRFDPKQKIEDKDRAAYYALPQTVVEVGISAKKVKTVAGDCFAALAESASWPGAPDEKKIWEALGFPKKPEAGDRFSIDGSPTLQAGAEPDPGQIFRADLSSGPFTKRKIELTLGPLGVLQSATSLAHDRRLDYAASLAKIALSFGILRWDTGRSKDSALTEEELEACTSKAETIFKDQRAAKKLTDEVAAGDLKAADAEWVRASLQTRIDHELSEFLEKETTSSKLSCLIRPSKRGAAQVSGECAPEPEAGELLDFLLFDKSKGFKPLLPGECLIHGDFLAPDDLEVGTTYSVRVVPGEGQLADLFAKAELDQAHVDGKDQGFYYRIPAVARVSVESSDVLEGKKTLTASDMIVAQLGIVAALPKQATYQTQYAITLDPMTGALQKLTAESEAIDPKLISTVQEGLESRQKARAEEAKAEAAATDELALLERERKILEEQKKIRDLKSELGGEAP